MTSVAILIDGGFLLKRIPIVLPDIDATDPAAVARAFNQLVGNHLNQLNKTYNVKNPFRLLHRIFYYDARPYNKKAHTPIDKISIDYGKTAQAQLEINSSISSEVLQMLPFG